VAVTEPPADDEPDDEIAHAATLCRPGALIFVSPLFETGVHGCPADFRALITSEPLR
jgi:hypothetical protein